MKRLGIFLVFLAGIFAGMHNAAAFSTEYSSSQNGNGSAKFSDPDEQMPGLIATPNEVQIRNSFLSDRSPAVTMPTVGNNDEGARVFDEAVAHQQDK